MKTKPTETTFLETQLSKFDEVAANLDEQLKDYKGITIALYDDEAYKTAKKDFREVKSISKAIEDKRKELKQLYLDGGRAVDGRAKELQAVVEPVANEIADAIDAIDREKARLMKLKVDTRQQELTGVGYDFSAGAYRLGAKVIHASVFETATDDEWKQIITDGQAEKIRVDEEAAAKKTEDERLAKENAELKAKLAALEAKPSTAVVAPPVDNYSPTIASDRTEPYNVAFIADTPTEKPTLYKHGFDACRTLAIEIIREHSKKTEMINELNKLEA